MYLTIKTDGTLPRLSPSGFVLLPRSVDLLVKRHGEGHAEELGRRRKEKGFTSKRQEDLPAAVLVNSQMYGAVEFSEITLYLYDQHTHGDGSQKVFVVIQPLLYFLIATLKTHNDTGS